MTGTFQHTVTLPGPSSASATDTVPSLSITITQRPLRSPIPASQPWFLLKNDLVSGASIRKPFDVCKNSMSPVLTAHEADLRVFFRPIDLAPSSHDPSIVACDHNDQIDALLQELIEVLEVRRNVVCLASWSESTWNRDQHDLLAGELLRCVEGLWDAASCWVWIRDRLERSFSSRNVTSRCIWHILPTRISLPSSLHCQI